MKNIFLISFLLLLSKAFAGIDCLLPNQEECAEVEDNLPIHLKFNIPRIQKNIDRLNKEELDYSIFTTNCYWTAMAYFFLGQGPYPFHLENPKFGVMEIQDLVEEYFTEIDLSGYSKISDFLRAQDTKDKFLIVFWRRFRTADRDLGKQLISEMTLPIHAAVSIGKGVAFDKFDAYTPQFRILPTDFLLEERKEFVQNLSSSSLGLNELIVKVYKRNDLYGSSSLLFKKEN